MLASSSTRANGRPARAALSSSDERRAAAAHGRRVACASGSAPPPGCAGSSRCRPRPGRGGSRSLARSRVALPVPRARGRPKRAVKRKRLPRPGSLSTEMRPASSRDELRGDREPEARCRRTAAWSRCRPGRRPRRSAAACPGGCRCRCRRPGSAASRSPPLPRTPPRPRPAPRPCSVNLMALPTRLTIDLPEARRVAHEPLRHVGRHARDELQPLLVGAHARACAGCLPGLPQVELLGRRARACRPRSCEKSSMSSISSSSDSAESLRAIRYSRCIAR